MVCGDKKKKNRCKNKVGFTEVRYCLIVGWIQLGKGIACLNGFLSVKHLIILNTLFALDSSFV